MTTTNKDESEKANAMYSEGFFDESEKLFHEAIKSNPNNAEILEKLGTIALWKNDLNNAEHYLKEAERNKSWMNNFWPLNAQSKVRLALIYARSDRFSEAAKLLDEAAGPVAIGPFKELKIRGRQLALFEKETPYIIDGANETDIEFVIIDPLPVVKVSVNGSEPVNFFIDTGGEGLILDTIFAKDVGAVIAGEIPGEYAGEKKGLTGFGKIRDIKLGNIVVKNVPVSTLDLQPISASVFKGMEIKGTIGTQFLMRFLSTIDYKNRKLTLRKPTPDVQDNFEKQVASPKALVIPMWLVETHLIFARGTFNGQKAQLFFVDTGLADAGLLSSKSIFENAGVVMDWSKAQMGAGGGGMMKALDVSIDEVTLGAGDNKIVKHNLKGVVFEKDLSLFQGQLGFQVGGLISHQFFRDHALTFDFRNMRLVLQQ